MYLKLQGGFSVNSEIEMTNETQALDIPEAAESLTIEPKAPKKKKGNVFVEDMKKNWRLHLIILPVVIFFLVFSYFPMIGIVTAFMNYRPTRGIFSSEWVGFAQFSKLFTDEQFGRVFRNTVVMALLNLSVGFVVPVAFALLLSEIRTKWFRKTVEVCSYMPNFVAAVVVCNLVINFLGSNGMITNFLSLFGMEKENLLANPSHFWGINTFVVLWQGMGYSAIVFTAAIAGVNQDLHEAAVLDGANRWQRVWHVTIPAILPMMVTMLVLKVGLMFSTGFDNILLLYMPSTYDTADVISTYVYRQSLGGGSNYGYAAAIGLFQSVIATVLLVASNWLSKKLAKTSLF